MRELIHATRGQLYWLVYGVEAPRSALLDQNITTVGNYLGKRSFDAAYILGVNLRWLIYGNEV